MAKALFVITSDTYVRNYLRTDALSELMEKHELVLVAERNLRLASEVQEFGNFGGFYELRESVARRHYFLFNMLMWRHRKMSRTFFYRWLRNSNWHLVRPNENPIIWTWSILHWFFSALFNSRGLIIPLLSNRVCFPIVSTLLKLSLRTDKTLHQILVTELPDVIVFPSTAFDPASVDLVTLGRQLGIPTICLIDNWDNLSSKTVFWKKPDLLAVWGPQTAAQAVKIHGFEQSQVREIGTPRFDAYFFARSKPPEPPYTFQYGTYVGSAMPFDDIGALRQIDEILSGAEDFLPKGFKLVYRPHPWQQRRNSDPRFNQDHFSHVVLDEQFSDYVGAGQLGTKSDAGFQPRLDYYPGLLLGSRFVIGPLTTMLFEASLCLRPVVALSYFDGFHSNTARRYFSHFDGMENVPGFRFCEDRNSLRAEIFLAATMEILDVDQLNKATGVFLFQDKNPYRSRLVNLVESVLSG